MGGFHNQYKHDYQPLLQALLEEAIQLFFQAMDEIMLGILGINSAFNSMTI